MNDSVILIDHSTNESCQKERLVKVIHWLWFYSIFHVMMTPTHISSFKLHEVRFTAYNSTCNMHSSQFLFQDIVFTYYKLQLHCEWAPSIN